MIFRKSKFLLTIIFFLSFFQSSYSDELIIPKKKPSFKNKLIIPPLKPGTVIEKQSLKNDKDLPKEIFGILLPPKKPLVVKKQLLRNAKKTKVGTRPSKTPEGPYGARNESESEQKPYKSILARF